MCNKGVTALNDEKLYLARFELVSGQYGQPFINLFYATNEKDLKKRFTNIFAVITAEGIILK